MHYFYVLFKFHLARGAPVFVSSARRAFVCTWADFTSVAQPWGALQKVARRSYFPRKRAEWLPTLNFWNCFPKKLTWPFLAIFARVKKFLIHLCFFPRGLFRLPFRFRFRFLTPSFLWSFSSPFADCFFLFFLLLSFLRLAFFSSIFCNLFSHFWK